MMRALTIAAALLGVALQPAFAQSGVPHSPAAKPSRVAAPGEKTAPATPVGPPPDMAYGAFQRGYFITAFSLATDRVTNDADPKAMTLLGELYAAGRSARRPVVQTRRGARRQQCDVRARHVCAQWPGRAARS